MWKTVWITGGATGIGAALSLKLAESGSTVIVSSRRAQIVTDFCDQHPNLMAFPLDVTDQSAVHKTAHKLFDQYGPIDLLICAAGMYRPLTPEHYTPDVFQQHMDVNYLGVITPITTLLPSMRERGRGHIAIIASVAGYSGLPKAAAYGPSKAALINLAETLYIDLRPLGLDVTLVNPGFVKTPMTAQNDFHMPQLISADIAAEKIIAGLEKKKFEISFPHPFATFLKVMRLLPYSLYFYLVRKLTKQ
ncbi:MAG: hypothetical protein CMF31_08470 [Kordiimonas sp.]|nr:hypothetical protein [Kordiimonas sp.]|tara:strand:+ start:1958 stop:2701 length:744 start_codon:yes stop_codon:yes gene_type:complete